LPQRAADQRPAVLGEGYARAVPPGTTHLPRSPGGQRSGDHNSARQRSESFLRRDGTVWTTDKDGPVMSLLAAEITARTGRDPGEHYYELTVQFGTPHYTRIDSPATPEQKMRLERLSPEAVKESTLAGES